MTAPRYADDLTIFLPLRGRHLHTLRWLWHANETGLPYRIVIADGDVHPAIDRLLSDPQTFPRLRYTYRRHADRSFSDFYDKCAQSLDIVATRYVVIADNDDFVFRLGLEKSIAFLDDHAEFVSALGGVAGFETPPGDDAWSGVTGPLSRLKYRCHDDGSYDPRDLDCPRAADRVLSELRHYLSLYYSVYRTEALRTIMHEIRGHDFSDLLIHEFFGALRTLTLGKTHATGAYLSYIRQGNTSSGFSFATDWVDHLLRSRFPQDFQAMARAVSDAAARHDGGGETEARALEGEIDRAFAVHIRRMLAGTMLRHRFPRLFGVKQRLLAARKALAGRPQAKAAKEERLFWQRLAADGADAATIADHRAEIAAIRATVSGDGFARFVAAHAPELG